MLPTFLSRGREALERRARRECMAVGLGDGTVMCRVLGKYIFYMDAQDLGLTPHLCMDGFWESWVTVAMARALREGWRCVDVGANHGYFTLLMADAAGASGRVLAVEPNPRLAELAALSAEVNGFRPRTEILRRAAADVDGERASLVVPRRRAADATMMRAPAKDEDAFEVETVSLDSALAEWPRVDFVKIDAEGAEQAVWRGMRRTLGRNRDIRVLMEMRCSRYADPRAFVREITSAGFRLRHVGYDGELYPLTEEQVLNDRPEEDWMLMLGRD